MLHLGIGHNFGQMRVVSAWHPLNLEVPASQVVAKIIDLNEL